MSAHNTTTEFLGFTQSTRNYYRLPNSRFDLWAWVRDRLNPSRIDGFRVRRDDAAHALLQKTSIPSIALPLPAPTISPYCLNGPSSQQWMTTHFRSAITGAVRRVLENVERLRLVAEARDETVIKTSICTGRRKATENNQ